ncbi:hypothetical protein NP493_840g01020 [Ridgeia piscesae]|uniref:Uncharacterized protein n=1 Tax=Ridgeia piscesae TaxID=27915 RepID=A0AAD9NMM8_RIDPI|nr:hypothetical protein NP493_840g01020 [Ridgeia piscesae]
MSGSLICLSVFKMSESLICLSSKCLAVKVVDTNMEKLYNDEEALKTKGDDLTTALKDRKDALDGITCSTCSTHFDTSKLEMDADYTALPNILIQKVAVNEVANNDPSLSASAKEGRAELDDIPAKVLRDSKDQRDDVRNLLDDFVQTVSDQTAKIQELQEKKKDLSDAVSPVSSGNKYSWYGGVGLGATLLLIVVLQVVGLGLGLCGYSQDVHPEDRSSSSNIGGNCLMASVAFTFIFFALFMIFLVLLFALGVPAQKLLCDPLMDPEFTAMDTLLDGERGLLHDDDGYFLGDLLLQNKSIKLTFKTVLSDCRDNKPSYDALKLGTKFNLDEMANYADVVLLSATTEMLLRNFSVAVQLDYQGFRDQTQVDNMISSTKTAEKYIHDEGSAMVKMVKEDLMRCKPIWNLWKSIVHGAVCGYGVQTLNGFWFALGWSVFFLFIGMIFSVKTAKYFHRMT